MPTVATGASPLAADVAAELRRRGVDDVACDPATRSVYASDASLYRVRPLAVARPRSVEEIATAVDACRELGIAVTPRGGGTSIAGNAIGPGLVLDVSRHLTRVHEIDPDARTARVDPGVVPSDLDRHLRPLGLAFGPDPSTRNRCTVGGMLGNNSCGARTLARGRSSDNVVALEAITGAGAAISCQTGVRGDPPSTRGDQSLVARLEAATGRSLAVIRTEFGTFGRQVSGYALEHLLPESGLDVGRLLVGSEGTLAVVTGATLRLTAEPAHRGVIVLGYPDIADAAAAAPGALPHHPSACEGLDARIVDAVRANFGSDRVPPLPAGGAWLIVELADDDPGELARRAAALAADLEPLAAQIVPDPAAAAALWRIREDGAGLSSRAPSGEPAHAGWEDAAVPPARLGAYLRDFEQLLAAFGLTAMPYGHFGDGCVHARIDFGLDRPGGREQYRAFVEEAARLVAGHGGTLSGEHGDGRARSELLPAMYSAEAIALFAEVKDAFDPHGVLNPGVLVDPAPFDADLRIAPSRRRLDLAFAYADDGGDFSRAVHRCVGVGRCRADEAAAGSVMCPSYIATREEKDSTRGRARVLQDLASGRLDGGWRSDALADVLDLCLACKACSSDCPTGVDVATYKAEALHHRHRRRLRPRVHYSLGWLPRWARWASRSPRLANALLASPLAGVAKSAAGVDPRRSVPPFARQTLRQWWSSAPPGPSQGAPVVVFADTFTNHFRPGAGRAVIDVLRSAGYAPTLASPGLCCGLTWISTGQLTAARRILRRTTDALGATAAAGVPIVGVEPSCTAVLRRDAPELLRSDSADAVAGSVRTLAELLAETDWTPPDLSDVEVVAQPHCHHHAVLGWEADARLLDQAGATVRRVGGCCGLAGDFGMPPEHFDVSASIAAAQLLPALAAAPRATVLADGFSCQTQISQFAARPSVHLAELLARAGARPS